MILKIKDTEYRVKFGIGFVRKLDEKYYVQNNTSVKFGLGVETQVPKLLTGDPVALSEFLYLGTCAEEKRPSQADVDEYLDDAENIDVLFDEVIEELRRSNATRAKLGELEANLKEEEEKEKARKEAEKAGRETPKKSMKR
jgi:Phage protein.